jgi:hypothetical protein
MKCIKCICLVLACATSHKLDVQATTETDTQRTVSTGPTQATTTTDKFAVTGQRTEHTVAIVITGPSLDDLRTESSAQTKINKLDTMKPSGIGAFFAAFWPFIVGAIPVVAGILAFKSKASWMMTALRFIGLVKKDPVPAPTTP